MENNNTVRTSGMGLGTLLTIIFVVLKLVGVISWGWIWVLAPLWISFALVIVIFIIVAIASVIVGNR